MDEDNTIDQVQSFQDVSQRWSLNLKQNNIGIKTFGNLEQRESVQIFHASSLCIHKIKIWRTVTTVPWWNSE